jgi:dTDP-4-dehydrorhamnose reductase
VLGTEGPHGDDVATYARALVTQCRAVVDAMQALRPLLIVGAHGTLGAAFVRLCNARGIRYHVTARKELDFTRPLRPDQLLLETNAWAVVNAAGYVRVDDAEHEPDLVEQVNAAAPAALAAACARQGLPLLTFSSDLVFDGQTTSPYTESARVAPLNVYGRSKAAMEASVLANNPSALVIRTSSFFGPWDQANFVTRSLLALRAGRVVEPLADVVVSPTYVPDLVNAALDLLIAGKCGIWHLANAGAVTWCELACRAAVLAGLPTQQIKACSASELGLAAPRPRYSALESERGRIMPSLDDALTRYLVRVQAPDAALAA